MTMPRQIRFRVWNPHDHMMEYPNNSDSVYGGRHAIALDGSVAYGEWFNAAFEVDRRHGWDEGHVLMLSTGLKDKNGREIFEGDIVRWTDHGEEQSDVVQWNDERAGFSLFAWDSDMDRPNLDPEECTVIGNIHENPDRAPAGWDSPW